MMMMMMMYEYSKKHSDGVIDRFDGRQYHLDDIKGG